jgi:hypothetical protein
MFCRIRGAYRSTGAPWGFGARRLSNRYRIARRKRFFEAAFKPLFLPLALIVWHHRFHVWLSKKECAVP